MCAARDTSCQKTPKNVPQRTIAPHRSGRNTPNNASTFETPHKCNRLELLTLSLPPAATTQSSRLVHQIFERPQFPASHLGQSLCHIHHRPHHSRYVELRLQYRARCTCRWTYAHAVHVCPTNVAGADTPLCVFCGGERERETSRVDYCSPL